MEISYDAAKNAVNEAKHGVPLSLTALIDWSAVMCPPDVRHDYGELREIGLTLIKGRLYCVVFTQRAETLRVISLRKANNREMGHYEQAIEANP